MAPGATSTPPTEAGESEPLPWFAVPDDLLRAVASSGAEEAVDLPFHGSCGQLVEDFKPLSP